MHRRRIFSFEGTENGSGSGIGHFRSAGSFPEIVWFSATTL